jgi:hypothetical protein
MKAKTASVSLVLSMAFLTQAALADCRTGYLEQIKAIDGRMNPGRGTLIANSIGATAVPVVAAAAGITVAPAALLATPAVAVGAGTYVYILARKKRSFTMAYRLLVEAEKGDGPMLRKFFGQVGAQEEGEKSKIRDELVALNAKDAFCAPKGELSKPHYLRYLAIKRQFAKAAPADLDDEAGDEAVEE